VNTPLRILFVASECEPFIKTGGLADVLGALPRVLHSMGHDVRIVIPRYSRIDGAAHRLLPLMPEIKVRYGPHTFVGSVLRCDFPHTRKMPVYFIDEPHFFGRDGIYGAGRTDYNDNDQRFAFFAMATLWMLKGLDWQPDIIHLNDWQSGLVAPLLRHHPEILADPFYADIRTVFSIHNLAYQGAMDKFVIPSIGLPWSVYTQDGMEFYNKASFLKGGLVYSDRLVTVSPTYAREIQTPEHGAGMDGVLTARAAVLTGILNGIDSREWDPARDPHIAAPFDAANRAGKERCKEILQEIGGLNKSPRSPLAGMIGRLTEQKGCDLLIDSLRDILACGCQVFVLGSGEERYETALQSLAREFPRRLAVRVGYDAVLAHQIIAGSDLFLMPSRFEPCGLTQMYAMRYGTVPVARATGGLCDTVAPHGAHASPTGFLFADYTPSALTEAVRTAVAVYTAGGAPWTTLQDNGMTRDFSWQRSAAEYESLYAVTLATAGSQP
jgi:starch synthase